MRSRIGEPVRSVEQRRPRRESGVSLDVLFGPEQRAERLREDVSHGLAREPKQVPSKWLYDDRGIALFEEIARLEEYYLTGLEATLLGEHAVTVAQVSRADTLVDLAAGRCRKSRILLDALHEFAPLKTFVPFDQSVEALSSTAEPLAQDYPGLAIHALAGDLERHLRLLPPGGRRLVSFLGSTIGNFIGDARVALLTDLRSIMRRGDFLLLGVDLVKGIERMERAYNDPAGLTMAFNLNLLRILNREVGANFVVDRFEHVAEWDPELDAITMRLRSKMDQQVDIFDLEMRAHFGEGESIVTEYCSKFRRDHLTRELAQVGFEPVAWWTDPAEDYALSMWSIDSGTRPS